MDSAKKLDDIGYCKIIVVWPRNWPTLNPDDLGWWDTRLFLKDERDWTPFDVYCDYHDWDGKNDKDEITVKRTAAGRADALSLARSCCS